jgi:hypothetical protein
VAATLTEILGKSRAVVAVGDDWPTRGYLSGFFWILTQDGPGNSRRLRSTACRRLSGNYRDIWR